MPSDLDEEQFERVRLNGVAKRNARIAATARPQASPKLSQFSPEQQAAIEQAQEEALCEAAGETSAETHNDPVTPWRENLNVAMTRFEGMDTMRRSAFLHGVDFAVTSLQIAACNSDKAGTPNAANALRYLAAQIAGAALKMRSMKKKRDKRRR